MTTLVQAMNENALTANGGKTNASSLNSVVDLFFLVGASRGEYIEPEFLDAMEENQDLAVRVMLWSRDVRGGAGERQTFRNLFASLIQHDNDLAGRVLSRIPELGRWDDVLVAYDTELQSEAFDMIAVALQNQEALCAKWMPRKGPVANALRKHMKLTPKAYRKLLVALSDTVETKMCANQWDQIVYEHVPSIASKRYQNAFNTHDYARYQEYVSKLESGEAKINASAIFPHDVIQGLKHGQKRVAKQQWSSLPDFLEGSEEIILPVVDVSGSMCCSVGGNTKVTCMDVAVSLGMYLAERSEGAFKDTFVTFSESPQMVTMSGNLEQRYQKVVRSNWGMNTDIQKTFKVLLSSATKHKVPAELMPTTILILSDMEFDSCGGYEVSQSAMEMMESMYSNHGYVLPKIVFWNLLGRAGNIPVTAHKSGAALVSGFSPSIMTSVLKCENLNPEAVMLDAISSDRYNF